MWDVLYALQASEPEELASAFGGVVIDAKERVLLRRPKGDFDGYVWTFPKDQPARETAEEAALREVKEETGYSAEIKKRLPGLFKGGTSVTEYFLMSPVGSPSPVDAEETSAIRWASLDQAAKLIRLTVNEVGQRRDPVLDAVRVALKDRSTQ